MTAPARLLIPCCLIGLIAVSLPGQESQPRQATKPANARAGSVEHAVAVMFPTQGAEVRGVVHFIKREGAVDIVGEIHGLEPGKHGFHVHEFGDLTDMKSGNSAGGHFNPTNEPHGRPTDKQRHVGDLGNIEANEDGVAKFRIRDELISLDGPHSILGRAVVVHAKADQFTQPSGDAGDRQALGVIGVAQPPKTRAPRNGND